MLVKRSLSIFAGIRFCGSRRLKRVHDAAAAIFLASTMMDHCNRGYDADDDAAPVNPTCLCSKSTVQ